MHLTQDLQQQVYQALHRVQGQQSTIRRLQAVSGGCIHHVNRLQTRYATYCLKWAEAHKADMLRKEVANLELIAQTDTTPTPSIYSHGKANDQSYFILMEWIEIDMPAEDTWYQLGRKLAALHGHTHEHYGLHYSNYIGSLPQSNALYRDWNDFFVGERLEPQIEEADKQALLPPEMRAQFRRLFQRLPELMSDEPPSLLHGDLWSGNLLIGSGGTAYLIDPASYYGHRECDLAFTELFGRFHPQFYRGYQDAYPLQPGFEERFDLCNLYPLLVHLNLFGRSYLSAIRSILDRFA
jgi:fructosamine-3-kinase